MSTKRKKSTGELYLMSTKWKGLTGKPYDTSCLQSGKVWLDNSKIFHVWEVKMFNSRNLRYIISTKWNLLTGEHEDISCPRTGKH